MRDIIFRGKRVDNGEWVEGYVFQVFDDGIFITDGKCHSEKVTPETVGQYTGLTDKNGTKIFEGDIIQTVSKLKGGKKYVFLVKYGFYIPCEYCKEIYNNYKTIGFYAFDGKKEYQLSAYKETVEVIGNIHDNPELLKGEVDT